MNVAYLFDSDHSSLGFWYGGTVLQMILKTNVLQKSKRQMRVLVGDILTFSVGRRFGIQTYDDWAELTAAVLEPSGWSELNYKKLEGVLGQKTIYCWVFQNISLDLAKALAKALKRKVPYLGALQVDFSEPLHLTFFRNSLIESYRLCGGACTQFYPMGENEDPDVAIREYFERHGYKVDYEDLGARRTIFDGFDTLEHFRRVADFGRVFVERLKGAEELSSDVILALEELHPRLFDILASCVRAYERAETIEDFAQIALSWPAPDFVDRHLS